MSLGKPIVQFDLKEGRYSAREASLYANPNDSKDLAENNHASMHSSEFAKKMGSYGRNRVENELSWDFEKENLYKVYRAVFGLINTR